MRVLKSYLKIPCFVIKLLKKKSSIRLILFSYLAHLRSKFRNITRLNFAWLAIKFRFSYQFSARIDWKKSTPTLILLFNIGILLIRCFTDLRSQIQKTTWLHSVWPEINMWLIFHFSPRVVLIKSALVFTWLLDYHWYVIEDDLIDLLCHPLTLYVVLNTLLWIRLIWINLFDESRAAGLLL